MAKWSEILALLNARRLGLNQSRSIIVRPANDPGRRFPAVPGGWVAHGRHVILGQRAGIGSRVGRDHVASRRAPARSRVWIWRRNRTGRSPRAGGSSVNVQQRRRLGRGFAFLRNNPGLADTPVADRLGPPATSHTRSEGTEIAAVAVLDFLADKLLVEPASLVFTGLGRQMCPQSFQ